MIKFNSIGQWEKGYFFEDAVAEVETLNGEFGEVTDGVFAPAANAMKAIMLVETGDDMGMDEYKIPAGTRLRVVDLAALAEKCHNKKIEIYGAQLPAEYVVGDMLASNAEGKLVTGASAPCFEIKEIIGNRLGVVAEIVTE